MYQLTQQTVTNQEAINSDQCCPPRILVLNQNRYSSTSGERLQECRLVAITISYRVYWYQDNNKGCNSIQRCWIGKRVSSRERAQVECFSLSEILHSKGTESTNPNPNIYLQVQICTM